MYPKMAQELLIALELRARDWDVSSPGPGLARNCILPWEPRTRSCDGSLQAPPQCGRPGGAPYSLPLQGPHKRPALGSARIAAWRPRPRMQAQTGRGSPMRDPYGPFLSTSLPAGIRRSRHRRVYNTPSSLLHTVGTKPGLPLGRPYMNCIVVCRRPRSMHHYLDTHMFGRLWSEQRPVIILLTCPRVPR